MINFPSKLTDTNFRQHLLRLLILCLTFIPLFAHAALLVRISEGKDEHVQIELKTTDAEPICTGRKGQVFNPALGMRKLSDSAYIQPLNSEATDGAQYLKAARMGGGIYMYLPFFFPARECKESVFELEAKHILWAGKWYADKIRLSLDEAKGKAIFFTNESSPTLQGSSYFDAAIPQATLTKLQIAFQKISTFYRDTFNFNPQNELGIVTAIVRNKGNYSGYGGDSLNIIRMSYDNPTPAQLLTLDEILPFTFAHELAHKLQTDGLHNRPMARFIVEGQADFLKIIVLFNSGLINEDAAKNLIRKAASECEKFSDARTLHEKFAHNSYEFREPYDCGMLYYFVAYYSSGLQASDFIAAFRQAMRNENSYGGKENVLCLLFETTCHNERLLGVVSDKSHLTQQILWLESVLQNNPLPKLNREN